MFVFIFGSQVTGDKRKDSDMDVCLYYDIKDKKKLHKLELFIKGVFPEKYDVNFFQFLPLPVKKEVFRGKLIYAKDEDFVYNIALRTFKEFEGFEPRYLYYISKNYGLQEMV